MQLVYVLLSLLMKLFSPIITWTLDDSLVITKLAAKAEYDYIVIGAGSAGATIAARLSEDSDVTVLVLEAGEQTNLLNEIPLAAVFLANTSQDWKYYTEPQKNACFGLNERKSFWVRGKVIGGTSSLNAMVYTRENRKYYDNWEKLGCVGWSFKEVFPYFLKSEDNQNIGDFYKKEYHSTGGPLSVAKPNYSSKIGDKVLEAGIVRGYPTRDLNGPNQTGFERIQGTIRNGLRCSTAKAFLTPASKRPNIDIIISALVTKIIFNDQKRAIAVNYNHEGQKKTVRARKEIIVSAGTINSPQLLMLSGVGPGDHLRSLGIPVVSNLPGVGKNLRDHVSVYIDFTVDDPGYTETRLNIFFSGVAEFLFTRSGPLTLLGGAELAGFINTKYANQSGDFPDIQYHLSPISVANGNEESSRFLNFKADVWEKYFLPFNKRNSFTFVTWLLRPRSSGIIRLRSSNPNDHPLIDPRYYSDPQDLAVTIDAVKQILTLAKSKPLRDIGVKPFDKAVPGCENFKLWSVPYIKCFIQTLSFSIYHMVGTCKMGSLQDEDTVVDPELKVKGVTGLRVADGSIMPTAPSANTNAAIIMIGEKVADMIKHDQNEI